MLQDGRTIELRPNSISAQRKWWKLFKKLGDYQVEELRNAMDRAEKIQAGEEVPDVEDEDDRGTTLLVQMAGICLLRQLPEETADLETPEGREKIEDLLDDPTLYHVIKVCAGVDLQAPNQQTETTMTTPESPGTI